MAKYQNKYRIESTRLRNWDYTSDGWYFITVCIRNRTPFFGEIQDGVMQLSRLGKIAYQCLIDIPEHFSHTELDAFVVMPNHIHAIIVIRNPSVEKPQERKSSDSSVETQHVASLQQKGLRKFGPMKSGSLSKIIQAYKAAVTHHARVTGFPDFAWQERFYDHIIRDEKSLENIRAYIAGNPAKWLKDKYYPG